jgi:hypothetical protein
MSVARRAAAAVLAASLGIGVVAMSSPAQALDTSWGYIKPAKKGAIE